jgi:hypothetical protein
MNFILPFRENSITGTPRGAWSVLYHDLDALPALDLMQVDSTLKGALIIREQGPYLLQGWKSEEGRQNAPTFDPIHSGLDSKNKPQRGSVVAMLFATDPNSSAAASLR